MKTKTEAKREAILAAAAQAFRELGFEGASMAEICSRAGGSKATLYNYFSSKDELFVEIMVRASEAEFEAAHRALGEGQGDIAEALHRFGEGLLGFIHSPEIQANRRLAIAASGKTELGRLLYEHGVLRSQKLVLEFLRAAMTQGKLRQADPQLATRQLYALLEAELIDRFLFQLEGETTPEEIKRCTLHAITTFMAAYAPVQKN